MSMTKFNVSINFDVFAPNAEEAREITLNMLDDGELDQMIYGGLVITEPLVSTAGTCSDIQAVRSEN